MTIVALGDRRVGWRVDGTTVATVRFDRDPDEVAVVSELEYESVASLRELFDAVVAAATAPALAGEQDVLEACGFRRSGARWVRDVRPEPAPVEATRAITLTALETAIRAAWSAETACDPGGWTSENPAYQHCDVTSLVVRDYLGGEMVVAGVIRAGARVDRHAWNRLPSGLMVDLTREQFRAGETLEEPSMVEELIGAGVAERYAVFAARVRALLES